MSLSWSGASRKIDTLQTDEYHDKQFSLLGAEAPKMRTDENIAEHCARRRLQAADLEEQHATAARQQHGKLCCRSCVFITSSDPIL